MVNIRENRVKHQLDRGELSTMLMGHNTTDMIDFMGPLGFDSVLLESEHGPVDFADIAPLTRTCDIWDMTSIVRINFNNPSIIYRTLDLGAQGLMVPHINTAKEAEAVVDAAKFAPIGSRGSYTSRQGYGVGDYFSKANDETLITILLEDIIAINNLSEILKVDHIDAFYVAPGDLAQSMGYVGQSSHPAVQEVVNNAINQIVSSGKIAGALSNDQNVESYINMGVKFLGISWNNWVISGGKHYLNQVSTAKSR